jgi:hypothetical protein
VAKPLQVEDGAPVAQLPTRDPTDADAPLAIRIRNDAANSSDTLYIGREVVELFFVFVKVINRE